MLGHTDELYVLESHPKDPHVLVSAGHDGQLFVWDIFKGEAITSFANHIEGQGHGGVFDAKWSPDGSMIAATDSHGHILMYGFGSGHERLKLVNYNFFSNLFLMYFNIVLFVHICMYVVAKRIIFPHRLSSINTRCQSFCCR